MLSEPKFRALVAQAAALGLTGAAEDQREGERVIVLAERRGDENGRERINRRPEPGSAAA